MTRTKNQSRFWHSLLLGGFLIIGLVCPLALRLGVVTWDLSFWAAMLMGVAVLAGSVAALNRGLDPSLRWLALLLLRPPRAELERALTQP